MSTILLVDDDDDLRRALARGLSLFGHVVMEARNGREAMAQLQEAPPDVLVTDINMPEMDGIEMINELRTTTPPIPVIAMSGGGRLSKELLLANAAVLGAVETLEKPFALADLIDAVGRLSKATPS